MTEATSAPTTPAATADRTPGQIKALVLATLAFAANFWAWNLISPLAKAYSEELNLTAFQVSLLVATPVLVGSLGRIPLGALTDRLGGRLVFAGLSLFVILPVVFLAYAEGYTALLLGGFVLGISGASFAVGVPFVSAWFPPARRGFALGIYGVGNIGVSIAGFVTPRIAKATGSITPAYLIVIIPLVAIALAFLVLGREAPGRTPPTDSFWKRLGGALRMPEAWNLSFLYFVTFGGFVAFSVYLPVYLVNVFNLELVDAGLRAAGFAVVATLARPIGGWLSDRIPAEKILVIIYVLVAAIAVVLAFTPTIVLGTAAFLSVAFLLGMGNGAVFALVGKRIAPAKTGSVTGLVGAAGGLGGFFPPLVMGFVYGRFGSYAAGLIALALVALGAALFTKMRVARPAPKA